MSEYIDGLMAEMDQHMQIAVDHTKAECQLALLTLAHLVRETFPQAARFRLEDSDQGDWAHFAGAFDEWGIELETGDFDDEGLPSHLYDNVTDCWRDPVLLRADKFGQWWEFDIDTVIHRPLLTVGVR